MSAVQNIPEFYAGRSIFITGATGFMGKCLVEKFLRSCPDLKHIYLLIRPKRGKEIQERIDEIFESKLFDKVKATRPDYRSKCFAIEGDILKEGLGIDQSNVDLLAREVSVVFHSAATIKFDEEMKLSVQMNVVAVQSMLSLCKKMQHLEALVHISTAYANCDQNTVTEKVYPPPLDPKQLLSAIEWMDLETLNTLTPKMIGSRPNTYTYTKSIAECLLQQEAGTVPVVIFRPSIVGATYQEPMKGWVDNVNGPTGILAAKYVWVKQLAGVPKDVMWPAKVISTSDDFVDLYIKSNNAELRVKKQNTCTFNIDGLPSLKHRFQCILAQKKRKAAAMAFEEDIQWVLDQIILVEKLNISAFEKLFKLNKNMEFVEFSLPLDIMEQSHCERGLVDKTDGENEGESAGVVNETDDDDGVRVGVVNETDDDENEGDSSGMVNETDDGENEGDSAVSKIGKGVLRMMKGNIDATADIIPVDLATNMLIATGWYQAVHKPTELKVFNCTTGSINKLTWGNVEKMSLEYMLKNPLENIARVPNPRFTKNAFWFDINVIFDHMLPAYVMDFYMWISGRQRMFVRIQDKLGKAVKSLDFFTSKSWTFTNDNLFMLNDLLSKEDQKTFNFNPKCIHWPTYLETYCLGLKQFVLKEEIADLPKARKALRRLQRLHFVFNVVVFMVVWRLLVKRVKIAKVMWNLILGWTSNLLKMVPGFVKAT